MYHLLKLFQTESALAAGKKQLVSEFYDEIVSFNNSWSVSSILSMPVLIPVAQGENPRFSSWNYR